MKACWLLAASCLGVLSACGSVEQFAADLTKGVKSSLSPEGTVIGTVEIIVPLQGYLTCFKDVPGGAASRTPITNVTQAQGFPAFITTRGGVVATGNCADLQKQGILVAAPQSPGVAMASFNPRNACSTVPPELRPKYAKKCVSFDPQDPCSALPADGSFRNGQTALAGACDARADEKIVDEVNSYRPGSQQPKAKAK